MKVISQMIVRRLPDKDVCEESPERDPDGKKRILIIDDSGIQRNMELKPAGYILKPVEQNRLKELLREVFKEV